MKVGPQEKEWDSEADPTEQQSQTQAGPELDENNTSFDVHQGPGVSPVNYPMYVPPYSPHFEPSHQDPYQIQASFQMLGSPYTDSPVYAGTPCGQINLSPDHAIFPFNTYPLDSTTDQGTPLSPHEYNRSNATYFPNSIEQSPGDITPNEAFALQTSPPEVSDIPADYTFEAYQMDFSNTSDHNATQNVNTGYSNTPSNEDSYHSYDSSNNVFPQQYHPNAHQHLENNMASNHGADLYVAGQQPQFSMNHQNLEGIF